MELIELIQRIAQPNASIAAQRVLKKANDLGNVTLPEVVPFSTYPLRSEPDFSRSNPQTPLDQLDPITIMNPDATCLVGPRQATIRAVDLRITTI